MALRYVALAVGAVLVLGVGIYLFFEVRAQPAQARPPDRGIAAGSAPQPVKQPATGAGELARAGRAIDEEEDAAPPRPAAPAGAPRSFGSIVRQPPRGPDGEPADPAPHKLEALMAEANKAYDRGDLDEARTIARRVLQTQPNNVRMLRIVVSASCIAGDHAEAQAAYVQLPQRDREQMKTRCARYDMTFTDP